MACAATVPASGILKRVDRTRGTISFVSCVVVSGHADTVCTFACAFARRLRGAGGRRAPAYRTNYHVKLYTVRYSCRASIYIGIADAVSAYTHTHRTYTLGAHGKQPSVPLVMCNMYIYMCMRIRYLRGTAWKLASRSEVREATGPLDRRSRSLVPAPADAHHAVTSSRQTAP
eukprot:4460746-Prymnesium_polylepis.2